MESDDDFQPLPSSPVYKRKLKRLKKATRVSEHCRPDPSSDEEPSAHATNSCDFKTLDFGISNGLDFEESNIDSGSGFEGFGDDNGLNSQLERSKIIEDDVFGAKRPFEFDSVAEETEGKGESPCAEMEIGEEIGDLRTEELEKKRCNLDGFSESKDKKKKRVGTDEKANESTSTSNKRRAEKERRDYLKQLRAESQRLLRETRDAAFKPVPLVQKPISSLLEKIRKRKLEVSKKSLMISSKTIDVNDGSATEVMEDDNAACAPIDGRVRGRVEKVESENTFASTVDVVSSLDALRSGGSNEAAAAVSSVSEDNASGMDMDQESAQVFRAPVNDTQELFSDSQTSDAKDGQQNVKPSSPLEEVFAPSILAMNLKYDSVPPDDVSSDEEGYDKENIAPHLLGSADLSSSPNGDPVKAFVDEEAEEEDDSDNDLLCLQENEEDEGNDDVEELNDMIAKEYEEKPIDSERRNQLHQQWLEQQDATGTDNLLQKLKCGSNLRKTTLFDNEEGEEDQDELVDEGEDDQDAFVDEAEEDTLPSDTARMNLKKVKQMIPQMFTDKDDAYVSSDDEETEKRLARQCLFEKTEAQATFLSPAEDESSREVFSLIKKLNIVPDPKKKSKTHSFLDMPLLGQRRNISSKSSFLHRGSKQFLPSSQKQGTGKVRSFIFGRDDSNSSRTSISLSEDSSDTNQRENQPPKTFCAKFKSNSQSKCTTLNSTSQGSGTSLFEILKRSSLQMEHGVQNTMVCQTESVFAAFKLTKKPIKTEGKM
ncbi:DNA ligase-like protein [Quillaja saponaria]|uniref:DNA ligase-like protein n=1 Tax=Quillaja saponaria TaxID=32244 RepID=A0AAD7PKF9_QUISA|nr:DNA ligase-like protein [Quillaja saponaria]